MQRSDESRGADGDGVQQPGIFNKIPPGDRISLCGDLLYHDIVLLHVRCQAQKTFLPCGATGRDEEILPGFSGQSVLFKRDRGGGEKTSKASSKE